MAWAQKGASELVWGERHVQGPAESSIIYIDYSSIIKPFDNAVQYEWKGGLPGGVRVSWLTESWLNTTQLKDQMR